MSVTKPGLPVTKDAAGNRLTKQLPDYTETYKYDPLYRLTQAERTGSLTGIQTWSYDAVGNRLTNQQDGAVTTSTYNNKNQLLSATGGGTMLWRGSLDEPGTVNFTNALVNGRPARMLAGNVFEALVPMNSGSNTVTLEARDTTGNVRTKSYSVDVTGAGATYSYDANGNLSQKVEGADTWTYTWNAENELKRVVKNAVEVASFRYDAYGRRVEKTENGASTAFAYDGDEIVRLTVASTITRYINGPGIDTPLASEDSSGTLSFLSADGLGSVVATTNATGISISSVRYDAWGTVESGTPSLHGFTGREADQIGFGYYRARYYDPRAGRFITEDPMGFENLYAYVANRPTLGTDPYGLIDPWMLCLRYGICPPPANSSASVIPPPPVPRPTPTPINCSGGPNATIGPLLVPQPTPSPQCIGRSLCPCGYVAVPDPTSAGLCIMAAGNVPTIGTAASGQSSQAQRGMAAPAMRRTTGTAGPAYLTGPPPAFPNGGAAAGGATAAAFATLPFCANVGFKCVPK